MPMPSLAECFLWTDILDRSRYKEYNISKEKPQFQEITQEQNVLNVGRIFDLTPKTNELIKSCKIREQDSYNVISFNDRNQCNDQFVIEKFMMTEYMCYVFVPKNVRKYRIRRVVNSMNYAKMLYQVLLEKRFNSAN